MTTVDDLWYLADEADQQAEQCYHQLSTEYDGYIEFETTKYVSRREFRTWASRIRDNGAPYGAHTLAYRPDGQLLLVRHKGVNLWVVPGGEAHDDEQFRAAAARELREEAGIDGQFDGLGMLGRITFHADEYSTWGVLPLFEAKAGPDATPTISDPDEEISAVDWFDELPKDTRDRDQLEHWRNQRLGSDE